MKVLFIIALPVSYLCVKCVIRGGPFIQVRGSYLTAGREDLQVADVSRSGWRSLPFTMEADLLPLGGCEARAGLQGAEGAAPGKWASLGGLGRARLRAQQWPVCLKGVPARGSHTPTPGWASSSMGLHLSSCGFSFHIPSRVSCCFGLRLLCHRSLPSPPCF